ncbi:hypothetical protein ILFOPFJJ_05205 [Ensifer psoraleae]|nr:hypothetical protein [Sinorhizobium psoraleae]
MAPFLRAYSAYSRFTVGETPGLVSHRTPLSVALYRACRSGARPLLRTNRANPWNVV